MPRLSRIAIYPVKSLNPVFVDEVRVLPSGALENDRRWAFVDSQGKFVNGKREPRIHDLHIRHYEERLIALDSHLGEFSIEHVDDPEHFEKKSAGYLTEFFGYPVSLQENSSTGFPDDIELGGPTVVSKTSIEQVSEWFEGLPCEETWLRFRANLEIDDAPPFWEDQLFTADKGRGVPFTIGRIPFLGMNPCARCVVPTRHPETGETIAGFAKTFRSGRERTLPEWATRERFDHYFRFAVNTILNSGELTGLTTGAPQLTLRVGDAICITPEP